MKLLKFMALMTLLTLSLALRIHISDKDQSAAAKDAAGASSKDG